MYLEPKTAIPKARTPHLDYFDGPPTTEPAQLRVPVDSMYRKAALKSCRWWLGKDGAIESIPDWLLSWQRARRDLEMRYFKTPEEIDAAREARGVPEGERRPGRYLPGYELKAALLRGKCHGAQAALEVLECRQQDAEYDLDGWLDRLEEWAKAPLSHLKPGFAHLPWPVKPDVIPGCVPAGRLVERHPKMHPPVIHGLLREGETANLVAAPKTGKSWLALNAGLSVASGRPWLGYPVEQGRVLLLDNELHPEVLASRIPAVAEEMGLAEDSWTSNLHVKTMRGNLQGVSGLDPFFAAVPPGRVKLIIVDALYRLLDGGESENDNSYLASVYNRIDAWAGHTRAAFMLIHHTSKGDQSWKSVTDAGSGAGSQSRAADAHLVLRPHEEDGCIVMDAVTRSMPPPAPMVLRYEHPLFVPADGLDPTALKRARHAGGRPKGPSKKTEDWTVERFAEEIVKCGDNPRTRAELDVRGNDAGLTDNHIKRLLRSATTRGLVHKWDNHFGGNQPGYSTQPEPGK